VNFESFDSKLEFCFCYWSSGKRSV